MAALTGKLAGARLEGVRREPIARVNVSWADIAVVTGEALVVTVARAAETDVLVGDPVVLGLP